MFTPTTPTADPHSTAADLEIAEEQPPFRSKRRRTLRSVVRGIGVLVHPFSSDPVDVHFVSLRIHIRQRRYVKSRSRSFHPPEETTVLDEEKSAKTRSRFCKIASEWLSVWVYMRVSACMPVSVCVCVWWDISVVIVRCVRADLWAI